MSKIEPDRNDPWSPRQYSFGKIVAVFLLVGPPTFVPLAYLAGDIATRNGDPLHAKFAEAFGMVSTPFGLMATYAVGALPSFMAALAYSGRYGHRPFGRRLGLAALIGAAVYVLVCALVLGAVFGGRFTGNWPFVAFTLGDAAGAGAVSAVICALILEMF